MTETTLPARLSSSLGITYQVGEISVLRASVTRGFTIPLYPGRPGGLNSSSQPKSNPEKIMSYQCGGETAVLKYFWLKATLFRHEVEDTLSPNYEPPPSPYYIIVNGKKTRRQGRRN